MNEMTNSIFMSFCIPAYNSEKYIGQAIENILISRHDDIEIVIFYDKSTDKTLEIIKKNKSPKVRIVENEKKMSYGDMMINCVLSAVGKYAMYVIDRNFLHMTDIDWLIDKLKKEGDIGCGLCKNITNRKIIKYKKGLDAVEAVGYLQNHPTGNVYRLECFKEALQSIRNIDYKNCPLDFLNGYIAAHYNCAVYNRNYKYESYFYSIGEYTKSTTQWKKEWYTPWGRTSNMYWSLKHLNKIGINDEDTKVIANILYKRAIECCIVWYPFIKMEFASHIHYRFSREHVGLYKKIFYFPILLL